MVYICFRLSSNEVEAIVNWIRAKILNTFLYPDTQLYYYMKNETSSLELHYIMEELQFLVGGKVDKIYQEDKNMLLQLHVPSKGKQMINISAPSYLYLASKKPDFQNPGGFCMFLRKYLDNTRLRSIKQVGFERIVEIEFESKETRYLMIIELFSKGNIVLCKEDYTIMSAVETKSWSDRVVRGGVKYEFPKKQADLKELSEEEIEKIIHDSDKETIVKTLAISLSLGGTYAEEVCSDAGVDKNQKKVSKEEIKSIYKSLKHLTKRKIHAIASENEALPFPLKNNKKETKEFPTFNEAIDSIISPKIAEKKTVEVNSKQTKKIEKVKEIIRMQEKTVSQMEKSYEENNRAGELIYENYSTIKDVLDTIKKAREKYSWQEIKEKTKGHKIVKEINEKEGKVTIEIDEK